MSPAASLPHVRELSATRLAAKGLRLGINAHEQADKVTDALKRTTTAPRFRWTPAGTMKEYMIQGIPRYVIVGRDQTSKVFIGYGDDGASRSKAVEAAAPTGAGKIVVDILINDCDYHN